MDLVADAPSSGERAAAKGVGDSGQKEPDFAVSTIYFISLYEALVGRVFSNVRLHERKCPNYLYHYTNEKAFRNIVESCRLWATSASESPRNDQEEIAYGCDLFAQLVEERIASRGVSTFTKRILNDLKSLPRERIDRIFLTSFCEVDDCKKMWGEYGGYSLRFTTKRQTGVCMSAPRGLATGQGFVTDLVTAVYGKSDQRTALTFLLDRLIETLEDPSLIAGPDPGPRGAASARFIALTVSDLALSFIVRLKHPNFEGEREWRVVVRPWHTHFSSDPKEADRNCECFIKTGPSKRYVELAPAEPEEKLVPGRLFGMPVDPPKLPIDAVRVGPCVRSKEMTEARQLLDRHGLQTADVLKSKIRVSLDCR